MSFTEHNVNGVIFDTAGTLSVGGVRHAFTTRHGGVSPAPFDSLNLASNRGDREENILENYRRLGAADDARIAESVHLQTGPMQPPGQRRQPQLGVPQAVDQQHRAGVGRLVHAPACAGRRRMNSRSRTRPTGNA